MSSTANQTKTSVRSDWFEFDQTDRMGFFDEDNEPQINYEEEINISQGLSVGSLNFEKPKASDNEVLGTITEELKGVVEVTSPLLKATGEGVASIASEAPDALVDLFKMILGRSPEISAKDAKSTPEDKAKQADAKIKHAELESRKNRIVSEIQKAGQETMVKAAFSGKRLKINSLLGLQALFQGSVDENGNIKVYYESQAEEKEKDVEKEQLRKQRDSQISQATSKGGKVNLDAVMEGGTGGGQINLSSTGGGGVG